ncbi:MAG: 2-methylisocitrate lyase [Alphaproteobacteria bacterium MarineAlpha11_Bin1]|nr:MAG: 2-methylisocitrate lyase [Alphaproteobacteria bacterium MarineAlpha11_Bin1]|tara:strand:+ start:2495 stop:3406 length:912 start_codon:yes stop_codon:yes gene_type:complete
MLLSRKTAYEKRAAFREELATGRLLQFPGAHAPIVSLIIEEQGFDGVYISGAALSAELGLPDIGLTTLTEVSQRGLQISRVTDLPALIDIDTGFGEPMSAARSIQELEQLGLAGCHLEDQVNPKRCGHLDNKSIVPTKEMVMKIRAASDAKKDPNFLLMARTDARASEGLDAAIDRCKAYTDAGADAIFPEALQGWEEYEKVREAIDVPLLANLTEFGKTPLLTKNELEELGYNIAIYPVTSLRLSMKAVEDGFSKLRKDGTQREIVDRMQTRTRLYELIRYGDYDKFDKDIFNFGSEGHGGE